jgi:hypothetical protein
MYVHTWKKYLPVIRILLKRSAAGDQAFSVDRFDFEKINRSSKPSCSFSLELNKGRMSPFNPPVTGKDLVEVLKDDSVTNGLIRHNHYTISLNSKFELQIKNASPVEEITADVQNNNESNEMEPGELAKNNKSGAEDTTPD